MTNGKYTPVSAQPYKRFFVEMLTRDIMVEDAILDLLDNCIDGVLRTLADQRDENDGQPEAIDPLAEIVTRPFQNYWAHITVNREMFDIEDNCGGIPWTEHDYAFRMGRPEKPADEIAPPLRTVGSYGIGMKRAIFKIGHDALISTRSGDDNYKVPISAEWMANEAEWNLDVQNAEGSLEQDGTKITIRGLHPGVMEAFAADHFTNSLLDKIQSHYAVILRKGFSVKVNNIEAVPKPISIRFAEGDEKGGIRPYIYKLNHDGVDIFLAVGLRDPIPGADDVLEEQTGKQFSSEYAGWTIICNDRVVLYCNRDEFTGWGTAGVPRYHNQFIAISGFVEFRGDPTKLPTTTTKRGLDFSASMYQQVLNQMREGVQLFTTYTNQWKAREDEAKAQVSPVPAVDYATLRQQAERLPFTTVKTGMGGLRYRPELPKPPSDRTDVRISYFREREAVTQLADVLVLDADRLTDRELRRKVGEASFDFAYKQMVTR